MTYTTSNVIEKPKSKTALAKEAAARTRAIIADSYTATELKRRGWSEAFIAAHLGAEDATRSNRGTLACYYLRDRVHAIEATPAFAERKATAAKNRVRGLAAAETRELAIDAEWREANLAEMTNGQRSALYPYIGQDIIVTVGSIGCGHNHTILRDITLADGSTVDHAWVDTNPWLQDVAGTRDIRMDVSVCTYHQSDGRGYRMWERVGLMHAYPVPSAQETVNA